MHLDGTFLTHFHDGRRTPFARGALFGFRG
jgi:hypothetical protein